MPEFNSEENEQLRQRRSRAGIFILDLILIAAVIALLWKSPPPALPENYTCSGLFTPCSAISKTTPNDILKQYEMNHGIWHYVMLS